MSLLKRDDTIFSFICDLFVMHQGRLLSSNRATRGLIVNKPKRIMLLLDLKKFLMGQLFYPQWVLKRLDFCLIFASKAMKRWFSKNLKLVKPHQAIYDNLSIPTQVLKRANCWANGLFKRTFENILFNASSKAFTTEVL